MEIVSFVVQDFVRESCFYKAELRFAGSAVPMKALVAKVSNRLWDFLAQKDFVLHIGKYPTKDYSPTYDLATIIYSPDERLDVHLMDSRHPNLRDLSVFVITEQGISIQLADFAKSIDNVNRPIEKILSLAYEIRATLAEKEKEKEKKKANLSVNSVFQQPDSATTEDLRKLIAWILFAHTEKNLFTDVSESKATTYVKLPLVYGETIRKNVSVTIEIPHDPKAPLSKSLCETLRQLTFLTPSAT